MPGSIRAELYFIGAMMFIILIICTLAVYFFVKTYRKEKSAQAEELAKKKAMPVTPDAAETERPETT